MNLVQQATLSVLGTLAATAILAGLKAEWNVRPATPAVEPVSASASSSLTSGGKFAARLSGGDSPDPFVTLVTLPPLLPMFTAPVVSALSPQPSHAALTEAVAMDEPFPVMPRPPRMTAAHREPRRVPPAASAVPPSPNPGGAIVMAPLPALAYSRGESPSLWSQSVAVTRQVASWSGALIDRLMP